MSDKKGRSIAMKFSTRNAFYLRASNYRVIPLFLYLDERHVSRSNTQ